MLAILFNVRPNIAPRCSPGLIRTVSMLGRFLIPLVLWAVVVCLLASAPSQIHAQTAPLASPGNYFLVIDHSGSMLTPIRSGPEKGRTRWDLMRERAASFIERLPEGAYVWVVVFRARPANAPDSFKWSEEFGTRLDSLDNRARMIARVRGFAEPELANGTWLRQATALALDQAEAAGMRDPDGFLTVMIYTDGDDQGHGVTSAEMSKNPGSSVSAAELNARVLQLRERHRNFQLFNVYQPIDESIRDAHVVRLHTNRLQLASPLTQARQSLPIDLAFRDNAAVALAGRSLMLTIEGFDGRALPLRLSGGPWRMTNGRTEVVVERAGEWPAGGDVQARLKIGFPEIGGAFLVKEGGDVIALTIQGAEAPALRDLRPANRSTFPVGRAVSFSVTTLRDALVHWDFGDGQSASGTLVTHAFSEPGTRTVTVKATDPRTQLTNSQTLTLQLVRIGLAIDPVPVRLVPEQSVTLSATAEGQFERFEWAIDGRIYVGQPRVDGVPGTQITFLAPARSGPFRVSVAGQGRSGGLVESRPVELQVAEVPALRVTSPAAGDTLAFGSAREFRAELEGFRGQRVRFSLLNESRQPLADPKEVDVADLGPLRVAHLTERIPVLEGRVAAILRVEAIDAPVPLVREIRLSLQREATQIDIVLPEGREPFIHRSTPLLLALKNPSLPVTDVRWDFGDGSGFVPGSDIARHIWTAYGDFSVRAVARDMDGQEVQSLPVVVKVPVRPVRVSGSAIYEGRQVGRDIDRVPVNASLSLQHLVEGDVRSLRWELNGERRPEGNTLLTASRRGVNQLRLVAEGTPEAGSHEVTLDFRVSDPVVFWTGLALILALLAAAAHLLLGNRWRLAMFAVKTDGDSTPLIKANGQLDVEPRPYSRLELRFLGIRFGRRPSAGELVCGEWSFLRKRAFLSLEVVDHWLAKRAPRKFPNFSFRWRSSDKLIFSGRSLRQLSLRNAGSMVGRAEPQSRGTSNLAFNPGSRQPWETCWLVHREGVAEKEYRSLILFAGLRTSRIAYWPEVLFGALVVLCLALIRVLHDTFY